MFGARPCRWCCVPSIFLDPLTARHEGVREGASGRQSELKILILSFYFRPDLSAGSFRTTALVDALVSKLPAGGHVDLVTTLPNRYSTFSADAPALEASPGLSIVRVALPPHRSGMLDQARAFVSYARAVFRHTRGQKYDLVFATSSRLMTAALGACVARKKQSLLYLDIRDIFVDTIKDVLPRLMSVPSQPLFAALERWTINRAVTVNLVSRGFAEYFATRYPAQRYSYYMNGIDDEFLVASTPNSRGVACRAVGVLYAGNVGEGQGLHEIIPKLAKKMQGKLHFQIIGDGGRKEALRLALAKAGVTNVELLPPMDREKLIKAYLAADVLFLHLNDYDAFKKVLPSKVFEYGAMGKPIWAGVAGFAAEFVHAELDNSAVFAPCDADDAERVFSQLRIHDQIRSAFSKKFARNKISDDMADDILGRLP